jgi:peptidoglycan/xylan/chitin deacetylase (PgdA/CDA1 family)
MPVVSRGNPTGKSVALTFDDGPDPQTTPLLLEKLAVHRFPATFFVTGARARQYPELISQILAAGHTIGNHSYDHDPLLALRSKGRVRSQIAKTQQFLGTHGVRPLAFRPPGGITSPRLAGPLSDLDMFVVNYSCRARDGGNRRIRDLARRILDRVRPGDIILLHDLPFPNNTDHPRFLNEIDALFRGLGSRELAVLPLAQFINRPIMVRAES